VDDQAADPAGEAAGELADQRPALLLQQVDVAAEVDGRQPWMRGHEPQHVLQLIRRVGVQFGGHARLGEAQPGQLEQRIIASDLPVEQGVNGRYRITGAAGRAGLPVTWPGMVHGPSSCCAGPGCPPGHGPENTSAVRAPPAPGRRIRQLTDSGGRDPGVKL
jgi:hypothetical protein